MIDVGSTISSTGTDSTRGAGGIYYGDDFGSGQYGPRSERSNSTPWDSSPGSRAQGETGNDWNTDDEGADEQGKQIYPET
jgi:hypothetical protein